MSLSQYGILVMGFCAVEAAINAIGCNQTDRADQADTGIVHTWRRATTA